MRGNEPPILSLIDSSSLTVASKAGVCQLCSTWQVRAVGRIFAASSRYKTYTSLARHLPEEERKKCFFLRGLYVDEVQIC